ncbi:hypothetical protein J7E88_01095 [Streptomyces sp. ISL-10]|uniref:hypothetical protein n=1 Tax=Streptomyces sp. ISL-10 TaxID=2819172 RepID=UPI001BE9C532|nr:hypothetical protein [Streptomyces sp. ISL-10]MBT2363964.1 hypothetical protein [Streptomyces sp. ISL-10]
MPPKDGFARRAGALLRAGANDLKRDDENAERELGLEKGTFAQYVDGTRPVDWELIRRAAEVWPLNERDLLPIHDDSPLGVHIMRDEESRASSRVLSRAGEPYYEYRDTAMSRIASYRPEWIRMLRVVDDNEADNPLVQWNHGHLLYQFTYFLGPVNYYYRWDGVSHCVPMGTGDSVWGLPFAPHSFAARTDTEPACILALTYGGALVGDAQRELAVLGRPAAHALAVPLTDGARGPGALLRSFMDAGAVTAAELAARTGLSLRRTGELIDGSDSPTAEELASLATGLGVSVRDLLLPRSEAVDGVSVQHARDARSWELPGVGAASYRITRLAGDPLHPHTSALQIDVLLDDFERTAQLSTYQHQYLYVLGDDPVSIRWEFAGERYEETLAPGDSAYVRPQVPIAFAIAHGGHPQVLLLRIAGAVTPEVRHAVGTLAPGGIDRYVAEDRLWYSKEGN